MKDLPAYGSWSTQLAVQVPRNRTHREYLAESFSHLVWPAANRRLLWQRSGNAKRLM